ncbi:hypothetical protein [Pseudonocardia sp. N23]|uniref:DUF6841 family protein n=1 Tax=Pseudonocardia sp. N23 TaxID=1987376 RepID=UPI000C023322|nr:hypothetical protein [Pseudonocardia sp. N23]GAY07640.1 hypothetical protein TOK_3660 [Pseudonocardia sp. N23]
MGSSTASTPVGEIERSVLATYATYLADFQRFDPDATAGHFVAPLCRVSKGDPGTFATDTEIRAWLAATWEGMAARRYGGASTTSRTVTVLDPRTVLLRARGTRHDLSGAPLEDFDVLYLLVRTDDRDPWRIAVVTSVDPAGVT